MAFAALSAPVRARAKDPVEQAMAAAGGRALLSRVRAIMVGGTARVMLGSTVVDLMVELRIEPFVRSRSITWLVGQGRSTARTLMVERDSAFLAQDGAQTAIPDPQARFERQQLGAYAYLLLAPAFVSAAGARRLNAAHDGYPPIAFGLASDGRIATAEYTIAAAQTENASVRQRFLFGGTVAASGIRFPRIITIVQDNRPFERLTITDFAVDLAAA